MPFIVYTTYAIFNKFENYFFDVEVDGWVEDHELSGNCFFPTVELAQKFIDEKIKEEDVKVYKVDIQVTGTFDYEEVKG